jgi:hypothetical protein
MEHTPDLIYSMSRKQLRRHLFLREMRAETGCVEGYTMTADKLYNRNARFQETVAKVACRLMWRSMYL